MSSGRADVGFADSQVAGYIVATSNGVFQNSGTAFEVAPYGLALPKGNGMAAPVQAAVNYLIGNGVYTPDPDQVGRAVRGHHRPRSSTAPPARDPAADAEVRPMTDPPAPASTTRPKRGAVRADQ